MTEAEWVRVEGENLWRTLVPLGYRRRRLFASANVRALGQWAADPAVVAALEVNDQVADSGKSKASLKRARDALFQAIQVLERTPTADPIQRSEKFGLQAVRMAALGACAEAVPGATVEEAAAALGADGLSAEDARRRLYPLYREIAGPTQAVPWEPEWRTSTVVSLAKSMYESRDFSAMPILSDALQDAGCENEDILDHCRGPGRHVRGCWVVDLVLGKE
jgi:hypothetical protein